MPRPRLQAIHDRLSVRCRQWALAARRRARRGPTPPMPLREWFVSCSFCRRVARHPCRSTRDMEDRAIVGARACFDALDRAGGGERGIERVRQLREERAAEAQKLGLP